MTSKSMPTVYQSQIQHLHGGKSRLRDLARRALRGLVRFAKSDAGKKLARSAGKAAMNLAMSKMGGKGLTGAGLTGGRSLSRSELL